MPSLKVRPGATCNSIGLTAFWSLVVKAEVL
jgi:hypothetical protein